MWVFYLISLPLTGLKSINHPMYSSPTPSSMETPASVTTQSSTTPIPHPQRPGKPVCAIYKYQGRCNSGALCEFDHPTDLKPMDEPKKLKREGKKPKPVNFRAFTWEELQAHYKMVKETDGFHVGYVPRGSRLGGMICPVPLSECSSIPKDLAKLAIKGYNEEHGTTYEFVKLIRVNMTAVRGLRYFITFQAKDGKPGSRPQNFQTRVYKCIEKTEVQLCRPEQKKSTLPEGSGETPQQQGQ